MVVAKTKRFLLIFIDQGAKINTKSHVENILETMFDSAKDHFDDNILWTFQQDSAHHTLPIWHKTDVKGILQVLVYRNVASWLLGIKPYDFLL